MERTILASAVSATSRWLREDTNINLCATEITADLLTAIPVIVERLNYEVVSRAGSYPSLQEVQAMLVNLAATLRLQTKRIYDES